MKIIFIIFILFNFAIADDVYFKNGKVWKNCKVLESRAGIVEVLFFEQYRQLEVKRSSDNILGFFITDTYPVKTEVIRISMAELSDILKQDSFINVDELLISKSYVKSPKVTVLKQQDMLEKSLNNIGKYSRKELLNIIDQKNHMTENQKILFYYAMRKTAVPECFTNLAGWASMSQGDYEWGVLIFITQLTGGLLGYFAKDDVFRYLGFGLAGFSYISGFVRPIYFADKYNSILKLGLGIEYKF